MAFERKFGVSGRENQNIFRSSRKIIARLSGPKRHWQPVLVSKKGQQSRERHLSYTIIPHNQQQQQRKVHFFNKSANLGETRLYAQIASFFFPSALLSCVLSDMLANNCKFLLLLLRFSPFFSAYEAIWIGNSPKWISFWWSYGDTGEESGGWVGRRIIIICCSSIVSRWDTKRYL